MQNSKDSSNITACDIKCLKGYVEEEASLILKEGSFCMNYHQNLLGIPIKDAAAHIFRRPYLFVNPTVRMLQIATFLAIGPQIYVDDLVVINESKKLIGRISSKHIIFNILRTGYPDWLEITAEQIMDDFAGTVDMNSPLDKALEVFDKTRFAFVPITAKDDSGGGRSSEAAEVVASLSIRDILPLIAKDNIDRPIKDLCSQLISVDKNTSIRNAIDFMMKQGIRNIGIKEDVNNDDDSSSNSNTKTKLLRIINDRKILEFLVSHNGRKIMHTTGLADVDIINHLDMISAKKVKYDTTTSGAAELLMDIRNPCLISEEDDEKKDNSIVTPWDIVMKTL
jgi:CBS domain-containing protein